MNYWLFCPILSFWRCMSAGVLRQSIGGLFHGGLSQTPCFVGVLVGLLAATQAMADPLQTRIDAEQWQQQWLGTQVHHCQQPASVTWSPEQAISHCDWQASNAEVPSFGITQGVYWLVLPLQFTLDAEARWVLQLAYPLLDQVEFFVFEHGRLVSTYHSADSSGSGLLHYRHFVLSLGARQGAVDVLIRVQTRGSVQFPLALWRESDFIASEAQYVLLLGSALGVMLAMLLYNFFIAVSGANRAYFYYAGLVLGMLLMQFSIQGLGERFVYANHLFWNVDVLPVAIGISVFFANAFCDAFLQLEVLQDKLRWGYRVVRWLALLFLATAAFIPVDIALLMIVALAVIGSIYTLVLVIRHYTSDDRATQFFCLGWLVFVGGVLLFAFNKLGLLPRNFYTEHLMLMGSLFEVLMLSLALGERINRERTLKELAQARAISLERKEREAHATALRHEGLTRKAQEIALNLQKESNALLERKVEERSRALADINERLQELTRQDPLTGVRNRRFLNERLPEEYMRACREATPLSVIMVDVDHFKQINDQYGHLVGDDCLKTVADLLDRLVIGPGSVVTRYGGEEFCILLPYTDEKSAAALADKICQTVANERLLLRGRALRVTVSLGVAACVPAREGKPEYLLDCADQALYAAKKAGRNCTRSAVEPGCAV